MIDPVLTDISKSILAKRYLIRNADKEVVETPKGLFQRVATTLAAIEQGPAEREKWGSIYYTMMASCEFEPNTPCLVNAGRPNGTGQLSACFVIPVPDSIDGIFKAIHDMAVVQKTGGGTGFAFSRVRPEGDFVSKTSGIASGPVSFMEIFDFATERIKQGGVRRGANMGILRVDHPDIMKFIVLKQDRSKMQNFNVSVAITDAFMLALAAGKDYDLIHPVTGHVVGQLHAPTVWKAIVHGAHVIGDPGLWFVDRVNRYDALSAALGPIEAPNPCQPAWATVLTPDGIRTFADIDVGSTIWSGQRWTKVVKKVATGTKPVYAYRTRTGTFYGTENHRVVQNGQKIEVKDARLIDSSPLPQNMPSIATSSACIGGVHQEIFAIQAISYEPVFDITVDADEHTYWTDGLLVSNCGEVGLRPYDACCLGSVNLAKFYIEKTSNQTAKIGDVRLRHGSIDFDRLERTVKHATRFLDNMLTVNRYPIPEIHEVTATCRKIGLGVMGWADLLVQLGVPYASGEARELGGQVMSMVNRWAVDASEDLAVERGPFKHWEVSRWNKLGHKPRRHSTVTVIAPTGTISMIAGCSSSIEPLYGLSMTREQAGLTLHEVNPLVEKIARREGFWSDELAAHVRQTGSLQNAPGVPDHWREVFTIANELDMEAHVSMQAVFQAHTEDAVSKTINLKREATEADVERAYLLAWQTNCKGITVYRDGCRDNQVLTTGVAPKAVVPPPESILHDTQPVDVDAEVQAEIAMRLSPPTATPPALTARRRVPANGRRKGETLSQSTPFGTVHVTINEHPSDNEPFELFAKLGKSGAELTAWAEALGRVTSYALSIDSPISPRSRLEEIANQLNNIGGSSWGIGRDRIASAPDAIAKTIRTYLGKDDGIDDSQKAPAYHKAETAKSADLCPDCGQATLSYTQRCGICTSCGYSKC